MFPGISRCPTDPAHSGFITVYTYLDLRCALREFYVARALSFGPPLWLVPSHLQLWNDTDYTSLRRLLFRDNPGGRNGNSCGGHRALSLLNFS